MGQGGCVDERRSLLFEKMTTRQNTHITIIGAGIAGLALANGLLQSGIEFTIYEAAEGLAPVGAGLTLFSNALLALEKLGLADATIQAGFRLTQGEFSDHSGRRLNGLDFEAIERHFGMPCIGISRAAMHNVLMSKLPAEAIKFGHKLDRVEADAPSATLYFANGSVVTADKVLGADGLHSKTRAAVVGVVPIRYSGQQSYRGVVDRPAGSSDDFFESWGNAQRFGAVRIDADRVYWWATVQEPALPLRSTASALSKPRLLEWFADWHDPITELIYRTETIIQAPLMDAKPIRPWYRHGVVLLGDAIHPMTPNLGQGAAMGLESAVVLLKAIHTDGFGEKAFKAYQTQRWARTKMMNGASYWSGQWAQPDHQWVQVFRDLAMRMLPTSLVTWQIQRLIKPSFLD